MNIDPSEYLQRGSIFTGKNREYRSGRIRIRGSIFML